MKKSISTHCAIDYCHPDGVQCDKYCHAETVIKLQALQKTHNISAFSSAAFSLKHESGAAV